VKNCTSEEKNTNKKKGREKQEKRDNVFPKGRTKSSPRQKTCALGKEKETVKEYQNPLKGGVGRGEDRISARLKFGNG